VVLAERLGIQLRQARGTGSHQKANDLAREAVSCNAGLGATTYCFTIEEKIRTFQ